MSVDLSVEELNFRNRLVFRSKFISLGARRLNRETNAKAKDANIICDHCGTQCTDDHWHVQTRCGGVVCTAGRSRLFSACRRLSDVFDCFPVAKQCVFGRNACDFSRHRQRRPAIVVAFWSADYFVDRSDFLKRHPRCVLCLRLRKYRLWTVLHRGGRIEISMSRMCKRDSILAVSGDDAANIQRVFEISRRYAARKATKRQNRRCDGAEASRRTYETTICRSHARRRIVFSEIGTRRKRV